MMTAGATFKDENGRIHKLVRVADQPPPYYFAVDYWNDGELFEYKWIEVKE